MRRNNEIRARWAMRALATFAACTGQDVGHPEDLKDALQDLMTDLNHLADREGLDFLELTHDAREHYWAEQSDEEDDWDIVDDPVASPALEPPIREALNDFAQAVHASRVGLHVDAGKANAAREEIEKRLSCEMQAREEIAYIAGISRGIEQEREEGDTAEALRIMVDVVNVKDLEPICVMAAIEKARAVLVRIGKPAACDAEDAT